MPTVNKALRSLTKEDVIAISDEFLHGWQKLEMRHGFRLAGLNSRRREFGLAELTRSDSDEFRVAWVIEHYSHDDVVRQLRDYLMGNLVADARWTGIELFDCFFGPEYARLFKRIVGAHDWREISEATRQSKLFKTQVERYGGMGLANPAALEKSCATRAANMHHGQNLSKFETIAYDMLVSRFGDGDIMCQYGRHPFDSRYPFSCDFYVRSQDLFIELNAHYSHGNHWFDELNPNDLNRKRQLLATGKRSNINAVRVWCDVDSRKRAAAKAAQLRYLVFWDGRSVGENGEHVPRLSDFKRWFYEFDCDYDSFVQEHPENSW